MQLCPDLESLALDLDAGNHFWLSVFMRLLGTDVHVPASSSSSPLHGGYFCFSEFSEWKKEGKEQEN